MTVHTFHSIHLTLHSDSFRLNENFRKEFKQVLPCFKSARRSGSTNAAKRKAKGKKEQLGLKEQEDPCNGFESIQLQEQSLGADARNTVVGEEILEESLPPDTQSAGGVHLDPDGHHSGTPHTTSSSLSSASKSAAIYVPSTHSVRLKLADRIAEDSL